jgi:NAD(P)-dependent dehydrogenase (short-subunit alcohol dehydrogenase family)
VLISGGSKGLGLAMAREFGASGARVVMAARDPAELSQAADWLSTEGIRAQFHST